MDILNHGEIFGTHHLPDGVLDHGGHNFSDLNPDLHSTYASDVESLSQGMDLHSPHLSHNFSHEFNPHEIVHSDSLAFSGTDFNSDVNHLSHLDHSFDSQHLADYQPHHANSLLDHQYSQFDHPSHLDNSFDSQHLADYQPHHANSLLDHQYSQVDHLSHLDHSSLRSGSEKASELLSQANELEKKANTSKDSSEYNTKQANWHRDHNNPSNATTYDQNAQSDMAKSEQYRAEAEKLREQAKKV